MVPLWRKMAAGLTMTFIVVCWFGLALSWLAPLSATSRMLMEDVEPLPEDRALVERLRKSVAPGHGGEVAAALAAMLPAAEEEQSWLAALAALSNEDFTTREKAEGVLRAAGGRARGVIVRHARFELDPSALDAISRLTANSAAATASARALDVLLDAPPAEKDLTVIAEAAAYLPPSAARDRADVRVAGKAIGANAPAALREVHLRGLVATGKPWAVLAPGLSDPDPGARLVVALAGLALDENAAAAAVFEIWPKTSPAEARRIERLLLARGGAPRVAPAISVSTSAADVARAWSAWWPGRPARVAGPPAETGFIVAQASLINGEAYLSRFNLAGEVISRNALRGEPLACGYTAAGEPFMARVPDPGAPTRIESPPGDDKEPLATSPGRLVAAFAEGDKWLLVARDRVERVDLAARVVVYRAPGRVLSAAARAADGWLALWHDDGTLLWIDGAGAIKHRFTLPLPQATAQGMQALPGRRLLVPLLAEHRLIEVSDTGLILNELAVETPLAARRLLSGAHLVATPKGLIRFTADGQFERRIDLDALTAGMEVR